MLEVEELAEKLASLQTKLDAIAQAGASTSSGSASQPVLRITVPRERKLKRYAGGRDDRALEDWIADASRAVKGQKTNDGDAVDFLVYHLEGAAKEEIRLRPTSEWGKPEDIYAILREAFGEKVTETQLMQRFFSRKQKDRESLQDYAHGLMTNLDQLLRRNPDSVQEKDKMLRNQFVENLKDGQLRRELRRLIREHASKTFYKIREEARRWSEEDEAPGRQASAREVALAEEAVCDLVRASPFGKVVQELIAGQKVLTEGLQKQQQDLAEQQRTLTALVKQLNPPSSSYQRPVRKCYECGEAGHIRPNCPNLGKEQKSQQQPKREKPLNGHAPRQCAMPWRRGTVARISTWILE